MTCQNLTKHIPHENELDPNVGFKGEIVQDRRDTSFEI